MFNIKGVSAQDTANYLGHHKIIVRSGLSCVRLSHKITNTFEGVRISFYLYNDKKDIDYLIKVLKQHKKGDELKHVI
jgi:cysteine desulfurase/selenocysteine lyase